MAIQFLGGETAITIINVFIPNITWLQQYLWWLEQEIEQVVD